MQRKNKLQQSRKEIDLRKLYEYMKKTIKEPIPSREFVKTAAKEFDTTTNNLGFFISRVLFKTNDFVTIPRIEMRCIIAPADMKVEALTLFKIITGNKVNKDIGMEKYLNKTQTATHKKIFKTKLLAVSDVKRKINVNANTIMNHRRNVYKNCDLCKIGSK